MKEFTIREAVLKDHETLLAFEQGVIHAERPFDTTLKRDPIVYYDIPELIASPHIHIVVAEHKDEVVGCGYARIEHAKPYLRHKRYAYLGFMYTQPKYRGQGVNKMIIDTLRTWSLAKGITECRLDVYAGNRAAQNAYTKAGFVSHMVEMRLDLTR